MKYVIYIYICKYKHKIDSNYTNDINEICSIYDIDDICDVYGVCDIQKIYDASKIDDMYQIYFIPNLSDFFVCMIYSVNVLYMKIYDIYKCIHIQIYDINDL